MLNDFGPAAVKQAEAMEKWPDTLEPTETAFQLAMNTELPIFAWWEKNAERFRQFGGGMTLMGQPGSISAIALAIEAYDWKSLGKATVVDMGGSVGPLAIALADNFPNLTLIVQDLPATIEEAKKTPLPDAVKDRVSFEVHDFFTPQTVRDADAYIMRFVLHDWPDSKVTEILDNLVPHVKTGSRVIINDTTITPPGSTSRYYEQWARALDMQVLVGANARERTLEDWKVLLEGSSGALKLDTVGEKHDVLHQASLIDVYSVRSL